MSVVGGDGPAQTHPHSLMQICNERFIARDMCAKPITCAHEPVFASTSSLQSSEQLERQLSIRYDIKTHAPLSSISSTVSAIAPAVGRTCVYAFRCVHVYIDVHAHIRAHVLVHVHVGVHDHVHVRAYLCIHVHLQVCVCVGVCARHLDIHVHVHIIVSRLYACEYIRKSCMRRLSTARAGSPRFPAHSPVGASPVLKALVLRVSLDRDEVRGDRGVACSRAERSGAQSVPSMRLQPFTSRGERVRHS